MISWEIISAFLLASNIFTLVLKNFRKGHRMRFVLAKEDTILKGIWFILIK